ncbi:MAG: polysaccharide deacetylase, partial [Flavobacteriales bacterium]|nr:polysaccharide deacetylase [Flavobacteriales bacterium]
GENTGMVFGLPLHPWVIGQSHRIKYLEQALAQITAFDRIWQTTAGEIAKHYRTLARP